MSTRVLGGSAAAEPLARHLSQASIRSAPPGRISFEAGMGQEDEMERRRHFADYQVNAQLMSHTQQGACFMHCLPARRGEEVTDEVIDGPQSVVVQQAGNRMHAQKGILVWLLRGEG